jgi:hypothetical protein
MSRRLFYITFGAVAGVLVVRQTAKAVSAMAPGSVAGSLVASIQEFMADVREFMAEREDELRDALGLYEDEDDPPDELPPVEQDATVVIPRLRRP